MKVVVVLRQTADLVEELELNEDETDIEREYVAFRLNEWDEHALEEALLIKEQSGATVTVVALDEIDVDQTLYSALAKGADEAVKFTGAFKGRISSNERAQILAEYLKGERFDLALTGVQTPEDLDGQTSAILAGLLGIPHVAVVIGVEPEGEGLQRVSGNRCRGGAQAEGRRTGGDRRSGCPSGPALCRGLPDSSCDRGRQDRGTSGACGGRGVRRCGTPNVRPVRYLACRDA